MQKVYFDSSIFNNLLSNENNDWSLKISNLIDGNIIDAWINSYTKVVILSKLKSNNNNEIREKVISFLNKCAEIPLRKSISDKLIDINEDQETYIHYLSAKEFNIPIIVSFTKESYNKSNMQILTPDELENWINKKQIDGVPFLDLKAQLNEIYNEIDNKYTDIITNTAFIQGKYVVELEEQFAKIQDAKFCVAVSSGTDALHIAMLALNIGHGDKVILPVNTFIATAEAVSLAGAAPVFIDCNKYVNIDVQKLEDYLKQRTPKELKEIKAIIPVHLYGQPADMDAIIRLAEKYSLEIVEDCCQAHFAKYHGHSIGTSGKFGAFSFYPGKNLGAFGEGGAIITNDEDLYNKAKMYRQHGEIIRYNHNVIGHNYRMSALQGAALSTKIKYLKKWTALRQKNAQLYNTFLKDTPGITTPRVIDNVMPVYHVYVIQAQKRDSLQKYLAEKNIATGIHYPIPLHMQKAYKFLNYKEGDFPVAERLAKDSLSLPMYPELSEDEIKYVCDSIKSFISSQK